MKVDCIDIIFALAFALIIDLGWTATQHGKITKLQEQVTRADLCVKGVAGGDGSGVTAHCAAPISNIYAQARASQTCDVALHLGGVSPECSADVASLVASEASLKLELQSTVADRDAAIARATARTRTQTLRKTTDEEAIKLAPHDPDGSVVCDAGCLRARFEPDAAAR